MSTVGATTGYLPDMIGWNARRPTVEECELVDRSTTYAELAHGIHGGGDYVIETSPHPEAQALLAEAFAAFGMCDQAHAIPAGVYLED